MSRVLHPAPLALTSDGTVLVNVAEFDGPRDLAELLRKARATRGRVFIGVELDGREVALVVEEAAGGVAEGVPRVVGRRQKTWERAAPRMDSAKTAHR